MVNIELATCGVWGQSVRERYSGSKAGVSVKSGNAVKSRGDFTLLTNGYIMEVKPRRHRKTNQVEPFDRMLRRFKKGCERAGIVQEVRDRQYYVKPSTERNEKNNRLKRRKKLDLLKQQNKGYRRR